MLNLFGPHDVLIVSPGTIFSEADQVGHHTAPYPSKVPWVLDSLSLFWEAAVFALVPLFTLS